MFCCYGFTFNKNPKKSTTVKPLPNINKIYVYENKKSLKTVYPSDPSKIMIYDQENS